MTRRTRKEETNQDSGELTLDEKDVLRNTLENKAEAISLVLNDLDIFQTDEKARCREVSLAITKMEEAQMWLEKKVTGLEEEIEDAEDD